MDNQSSETPTPQTSPRKNFLLLGFLVILAGLLGSSATYLALQSKTKHSQPIPVTQISSTPTPDPTANWNTFTDPQLKFSVKYPSTWYTYPPSSPTGESAIYSYNMESKHGYGGIPNSELKFAVFRLASINPAAKSKSVAETPIVIDGISTTKQLIESLGKSYYIEVSKDGYIYQIAGYPADSKYADVFDQMLKTFKFTNATNPEGKFCGGIANIQCSVGYTCKLEATHPDAGGKCVKEKSYTCPSTKQIDCMPILTPEKAKLCEKDYLTWVQTNCPEVTVTY